MDGLQKLKSKLKKVHAISQKTQVLRQSQSDPLLSVLMWGVNHMANELLYVPEQPLILASDFKASSKISVHTNHYTPHSLPHKYKVKEYCPVVFRHLRTLFKETAEDYVSSMCDGPMQEVSRSSKTGTVTYVSHDGRLMAKTMGREAVAEFHACFNSYHARCVEVDGQTLLPHYVGMYRLTIGEDRDVYLLLMHAVLSATLPMTNVYDLKGSTVERNATVKELQKEQPRLKDNDFLSAKRHLEFGPGGKERFLETLRSDVAWLQSRRLMDYRLLVGLYELPDSADGDQNVVAAAAATTVSVVPEHVPGMD
eukprot:UC1_evm1s480